MSIQVVIGGIISIPSGVCDGCGIGDETDVRGKGEMWETGRSGG